MNDELTADAWLYQLALILGFEHPASKRIEELRTLVTFFEKREVRFPTKLTTPDVNDVRGVLHRVKQPVGIVYRVGRLSDEEKKKARQFHRAANEILRILGQDAPVRRER